ncbi:rRNA N6-adenosine-methyltransferase ZCCHC4 isoform X2 [Cavia porcellus]|uniref:rRNA N6-adenosine-methyltransferase ZCCHC4 isoform X2 n=1 Tax=Cavia porcellus TaxID=10141 RepID=UPI002FDF79BC
MAAPVDAQDSMDAEPVAGRLGGSGVKVVLLSDPAAPAPLCPHGPTLLFVKVNQGKEETRKFYACSACRDRKDCNFFQWEDEKLSGARLAARESHNQRCRPPLSRLQCVERYLRFIQLPLTQRRFCHSCQQLLLPDEWGEHQEHHVVGDLSVTQLRRPSQLLYPLENKKTNAQYLFADRTCRFLVGLLSTLGFRRVLCVGTPRLHELIRLTTSGDQKSNLKSLLLDIDFRYSQFYLEDSFCHYNMFNHHFFDGKPALEVCRAFLQEDKGEGVIMVTDPPFGGLVEPLAVTFKKLIGMWKEGQGQGDSLQEMPIFWIFPYFFEARICQFFPSFCMLDYQDGRKWKHCFLCKKCVKPSWVHCRFCNHCAVSHHSCEGPNDGCFICGELDHKRSSCPNIGISKKASKAVKKQKQRKSIKMKMETTKGQPMNYNLLQGKRRGRKEPINISALKCPVT